MPKTELEEKIRSLDDPRKKVSQLVEEIYKIVGTSRQTVRDQLYAQRRGYSSWAHYISVKRLLNKPLNASRSPNQGRFEKELIFMELEELDRLADQSTEKNYMPEEFEKLAQIIQLLPGRYRDIITERYYEGKTLEEIGKKCRLSRERIRQINEDALELIVSYYHLPPNKKKRFIHYKSGELLLINLLLKTTYQPNEAATLVNKLWHGGKPVRTKEGITKVNNSPFYEQKRAKIRNPEQRKIAG